MVSSASKPTGTTVDWAIRFWLPGHYERRWSAGPTVAIESVSLRIHAATDDRDQPLQRVWGVEGVDGQRLVLQPILDSLTPGQIYALELSLPPDSMYSSALPAGPDSGRKQLDEVPPGVGVYDYQLRPIRFWLTIEAAPGGPAGTKRIASITDDPRGDDHRPPPGLARLVAAADPAMPVNHVEIDWRPDWLRRVRARKPGSSRLSACVVPGRYELRGGAPTHVVLHNTGGYTNSPPAQIGPALNKFMTPWVAGRPSWHGIHYLIDYDGHVVKMCPEHCGMGHCGPSYWRGAERLNFCSIGIEHVHHNDDTHFPKQQLSASLDLVAKLKAAFAIDGRDIVGHGEVTTEKHPRSGTILSRHKLVSCPGPRFDWARFAARDIVPNYPAVDLGDWRATAYSSFFQEPDRALRERDSDARRRWGGVTYPASAPLRGIIRELHEDLRAIGYLLPAGRYNPNDAVFTLQLSRVVKAFRARYLSPSDVDLNRIPGTVDEPLAKLIKQVVAAGRAQRLT